MNEACGFRAALSWMYSATRHLLTQTVPHVPPGFILQSTRSCRLNGFGYYQTSDTSHTFKECQSCTLDIPRLSTSACIEYQNYELGATESNAFNSASRNRNTAGHSGSETEDLPKRQLTIFSGVKTSSRTNALYLMLKRERMLA